MICFTGGSEALSVQNRSKRVKTGPALEPHIITHSPGAAVEDVQQQGTGTTAAILYRLSRTRPH